MTDRPDQSGNGGWQNPDEKKRKYPWRKPENALSDTEINGLRQSREQTETDDEIVIGSEPVAPGAWYSPQEALPESVADDAIPEESEDVAVEDDVLDEPVIPAMAVQPAQSQGALELPPDLGQFDEARSGKMPGIGANPPQSEFDTSRSGRMEGLPPEEKFDPARSGKLPGLGGTEQEQRQFDPSRSGQLPGLGASEPDQFDAARSGELTGLEQPSPEPTEDEEPALEGLAEDQAAASDFGSHMAEEAPGEVREPTQVSSDTGAAPAASVAQPEPEPQVDRFAQVEEKVNILRRQFTQGQMTREQLQDELRRLMLLDEQGRWWMLGLETNRWYRFNGQEWLPDEPPRPQPSQPAPAAQASRFGQETPIEAEFTPQEPEPARRETGLPDTSLPSRVPLADSDPTIVGKSAHQFESQPHSEPTIQRPAYEEAAPGAEPTVPHQPSYDEQQSPAGYAPAQEHAHHEMIKEQPAVERPYVAKMQGIQPDYSAAFGGYFNRSSLLKWGLRLGVFGFLGVLALTAVIIVVMLVYYFSIVNQYDEAIADLDELASDFETTVIYDANGNVLAEFDDPRTGARTYVPLEDISPYLIHATIATEDETFYENPGFSLYGILRAVVRNIQTGGAGGGASTITQQLARALVFDAEFAGQRTGNRKIQEIIVAAEIARNYSKNEILEIYLNEIYYGNRAYGIEAAAQTYFGKSAADLNLPEAAFLAGLPQAPAVYDPVVNRQTAVERMQQVLRLMTEANGDGCIVMQHGEYAGQPFCVTEQMIVEQFVVERARVETMLFNPPTFEAQYPHFVNYVYQQLERQYGQAIYGSGFRVYTTLQPNVQEAAQAAIREEIPATPNANNAAVIAIRASDGAIIAMVGSADFNADGNSDITGEDIDGLVNVLLTRQQPGSSIKPLVYLTAIQGVNNDYWYPGSIIWDVPSCWGGWCPRNYSGRFTGPVTLREALGNSLNIPAVKALAFVTPEQFERNLEAFGVQFPGEAPTVAGLPSSIGGIDLYPLELVAAYATLANNGVRQEPYTIARIEDSNGNVVYTAPENPPGTQVVDPRYAYLLTDVLSDAEARFAGANWLSIPGWVAAAKTGTTNDVRDVWTIGYTPNMAVGVWVGRTDNQPMGQSVTGSNTAAPIWNKTMQAALAGLSPRPFPIPDGVSSYQVCSYTGTIYRADTCPFGTAVTEVAVDEQRPPEPAQGLLVTRDIDAFSGLIANEYCQEYVETRTFLNIQDPTAINWLQGEGQGWAEQHGITLPAAQPPTEACQPGMPRPQVVLSLPAPGQEVTGLTQFSGQVAVPGFANYEFRLAPATDPENFQVIGQGFQQHPQPNSFLGSYDFTGIPNGQYILRLAGQNAQGATASVDVPIIVNNVAPTPEPTIIPSPTFAPPPTQPGLPTVPTETPGVEAQPVIPTADPALQPVPPTAEGSGQ